MKIKFINIKFMKLHFKIIVTFAILFLITILSQQRVEGPIRPLQRYRNQNLKIESIFDNATIQKSSSKMTLRLTDRVVSLLSVPDVMQATDYTCGPSSLSAVLGYYQYDDWRESELSKRAKTTEEFGTSPQNLLATVQGLGFTAEMRQNLTIQDLEYYVSCRQPVIILFQAWADPGVDYKTDWDDGHYVVVIGYDKEYLYFEDPWILGSIGYIPKTQFLERWHDIVHGERKVYNLGIVVKDMQKSHPVIIKLQ